MSFSLADGLGGESVQAGSRAGMQTQNAFFNGSVSATSVVSPTVSTTTLTATSESLSSSLTFTGGSPYGFGLIVPFTARSNISGGMWVSASGGLALAGPASALTPLGVAVPGVNVASGGTVNVIIRGIVPMIAEGTVLQAGGVEVGAGAGLNCVKPHAAGSGAFYATLDSAASGTASTVFVVL